MNKALPALRKKALALPQVPGVYIMKNSEGAIIYIGKAKVLKNRVSSYFELHRDGTIGPVVPDTDPTGGLDAYYLKVRKMVDNVQDFDYILCGSEFEALVLECSLIKQHKPKYNILLKDDKGYQYIKVTGGDWKSISAVHHKADDGSTYIGPYVSTFSVSSAVDEAKKVFMLPTCAKEFPRDIGRSRPCLNYHIGICMAPCSGRVKREEYNEAVNSAIDFIKGGSDKAIKAMTEEMMRLSDNLEFEKAAKLRDRINAIRRINEKQKVVSADVPEQDVFALVTAGNGESVKSCLCVLRFRDGMLYDSEYFTGDYSGDGAFMRSEMIERYYSMRDFVPARVSVDADVTDASLLSDWLTSLRGSRVTVVVPVRGKQRELIEMCRSNAAENLARSLGRRGSLTQALDELASSLSLDKPPRYIESYDISHTAGSDNVAGMVVFRDGVPLKKNYRRFAIKGFTGQDDYASMAEVAERRILRYFEEKDTGEGFGILPDLILLDGGSGQVNAVLPVLMKYNLDIPLFGMVKDSHHRTRAISTSGGEISISSKKAAFNLVSSIQDEVHRYSVEYHRKKHKSSSFSSVLTSIEGVGPAKAKALLQKWRTVKAVSEKSVEELMSVKGISLKCAENIYEYFHGEVKKDE